MPGKPVFFTGPSGNFVTHDACETMRGGTVKLPSNPHFRPVSPQVSSIRSARINSTAPKIR